MQPISLALLWHQHQPYYPDDVSGETLMPWVRLHGTKDYYGMARHIKEVPEFRCTINLVPSLLKQLLRYTDEGGSDQHLDISRMPADGLSEGDIHFLLDNFFMANAESMIKPFPRYHELYLKRGVNVDPAAKAASRYSTRDIRDLQIWSNLTWIHELAFEEDSDLREFRRKGQRWTEADKEWLLDKQKEILQQVIPLHRELSESGQVELTTTPFFHPILPLLWDKRSARQAMPGCALPRSLESYREDAVIHLQRAVKFHEDLFGEPPRGMWPSEGSVSQDIIAAIANVGIQWIATDEEILAHSTNGWISRDSHGHLRHPEMLYRPWLVHSGASQLDIVFRDHALSDLIGFHYQRSDPHHAAADLLERVQAIGRAVQQTQSDRPALVPIILDGENCWEYYPDGGVEFLRTLYRACVQDPQISAVRMSDHLEAHPPTDRIGQLFAGSWISHNFAIWIGHQEDNTAWDLLHQTREFLKQTEAAGNRTPQQLERAWEELFIAEGSDWFWWFGDDHNSAQDGLFDQLFRRHLQNVYTLLDAPVPSALSRSITSSDHRRIHTDPTGFLAAKIDGRRTFFEWISAGHYISGNERGTMTLVTEGVIREIFFGFDAGRLMVRIDTAGRAADDLRQLDELRLRFLEPAETALKIIGFDTGQLQARFLRGGKPVSGDPAEVAVDQILELSLTFQALQVSPDDRVQMFVECVQDRQSVDRAPREGVLDLTVPSPDFERIMWQV